jgi:anti-anti-sigma factor
VVIAATASGDGSIRLVVRDGARVLCLAGEVDDATVEAHRRAHPCPASQPTTTFDVSGVTFLDCAGLRFLAGEFQAARSAGHRPTLYAVPRAVRRLVQLTGSEDWFAETA